MRSDIGLACLVGLIILAGFAPYLYAQSVQYKAAQGYQPGTIIIKADVPNTNRVCLEPPKGGLLDCTTTVGELRIWVRERPKR